jgi:hypothetical protein
LKYLVIVSFNGIWDICAFAMLDEQHDVHKMKCSLVEDVGIHM